MTTESSTATPAEPVELAVDGLTHGGEGVGRLPSGKACFVPFAIPGERVRVEVVEERRRWARGRLVSVIEPSLDRVEPPCPYYGPGRCGGCQLQHVAPPRQARMKQRIVREQLERIGRFTTPPVAETVEIAPFGYRSHARFGVDAAGRLGFRQAGSHDIMPIPTCLLLDEPTQALRDEAGDDWADVAEVGVRTGTDGSRTLAVHPGPGGLAPLPGEVPAALVDVAGTTVPLRGEGTVVQHVAGFDFRLSASSFFQASAAAAEALAELVRVGAAVDAGDVVLDLYAGVGLFAAVLAAEGAHVTAVEAHPQAAEDAAVNLAAWDVTIQTAPVERALAGVDEPVDVVVLDPPRRGAGGEVTAAVAALAARTVVYVSCDPAALGRDARTLVDAGYTLDLVTPVDQFAQTAQIEAVAVFTRVT